MAQPSESLSRHVNWRRLLPAIGVQLPSMGVLPQAVCCPCCHGLQLILTVDHVLGGEWAHCANCQFAGDLIELAAATWGAAIPEALARLSCLGVLEIALTDYSVEAYTRDHIKYRRRLREFLEKARYAPLRRTSPSGRALLKVFGLVGSAVSAGWPDEGGRYFGTASRLEVEELFAPLAYAEQPRKSPNGKATLRRGGGAGARRPFKGTGWEEVLVVPYYDLPGRICAFHFIGRNADFAAGDYVYRRANLGPTSVAVREAGVAMLPAIRSRPHRLFGNDVFVIHDPVVEHPTRR